MKVRLSAILIICLVAIGCGSANNSGAQPPTSSVLTSIQITSVSATVPLGATQPLTAIGTYSDGHTHDLSDKVTWTSSAQNIATVSTLGHITALALGSVVVTATLDSISSTLDLTVGPPALASIDISPSAPNTPPNTAAQLVAVGRYTDGTAREVNDLVTWSSSDQSKVTISATGLATALITGSPTVTATVGTISGSATMTVSSAQVAQIALLPYQPVTGIGVLQQFSVLGKFDDYSIHQLVSASWSSSNPAVASIDSTGLVTPLQPGASTITATLGGISKPATTGLTVLPATLSAILISPSSTSTAPGTDTQFTATGQLSDGSLVDLPVLDWSSSDDSIAALDSTGRAIAAATGTATISASVAGVSGSSSLNVTSATLQSIILAPVALSVPVLSRKQLYAIGTFSDGTTQDLSSVASWSTSNLDLVMVNHHGLASTNKTGTARISAGLGTLAGYGDFTVSSVTVSSVDVEPSTITIPEGVKQQYSLLSTLSDDSTASLDAPQWYTSPITMATANSTGLVTGRTPSVGKVYGETCCKTAYTQLTVSNAKATLLTISADAASIPNGAVQPLKAIATFDDNSQADVSNAVHWTSSDTTHGLIDGQGLLTALSTNTPVKLTVTATFGPVDGNPQTVSGSIPITIIPGDLQALTITGPAGPIRLGNLAPLSLAGNFSDGTSRLVPNGTWQSSDPSVAVVLPSGLVITTGQGNAVITAKSCGFTATTSITVQ